MSGYWRGFWWWLWEVDDSGWSQQGAAESRGCGIEGAVVVSSSPAAADGRMKEREKERGLGLLLCTTNEWCRDISNVFSVFDTKING